MPELEVRSLTARYGAVTAVRQADLTVAAGAIAVITGPNGAGKTTLLRSIMGQHRDVDGEVLVDGVDVGGRGAVATARLGVSIVPQGRRLFGSLTVAEHLALARGRAGSGSGASADIDELFPGLHRRRSVRAASLSGGEQQMLAIARAVLVNPRYVLLDEPTEGLAPSIVANVLALGLRLPEAGIGVILTDNGDAHLDDHLDDVATVTYQMERGEVRRAAVVAAQGSGNGASGGAGR